MKYGDVVTERGQYDWRVMDRLLDRVAARRHQAIVRFYFVYPGNPTTVPDYIKALPDYHETRGRSEGKPTAFPDWSHRRAPGVHARVLREAGGAVRQRPAAGVRRDGVRPLGRVSHLQRADDAGQDVPGQVVPGRVRPPARPGLPEDALDDLGRRGGRRRGRRSPRQRDLLKLPFGVFDDSFLCQQHAKENEPNWNVLGRDRWKRAPAGGEISYYTTHDQKEALAADGPHGIPFENAAADFHITFMIANDQPKYQTDGPHPRGRPGLRLPVPHPGFEASATRSRVTVTNRASPRSITTPISRSTASAPSGRSRGCFPGESRTDEIPPAATSPKLTIACDRLVPGQSIEFEADLRGARRSSVRRPVGDR